MKVPVVELSECILCDVCVEICPLVFKHSEADYIEIIDLSTYPVLEIDEAIKNCPQNCIYWTEI